MHCECLALLRVSGLVMMGLQRDRLKDVQKVSKIVKPSFNVDNQFNATDQIKSTLMLAPQPNLPQGHN